MDSEKQEHFDNLPVEGWFWELVRRDGRFGKRFSLIEEAVVAYTASRMGEDEYAGILKSYLAHLRRYGVRAVSLADPEVAERIFKSGAYLILPLPGKGKQVAVPRPDVAYSDFGDGLQPAPRKMDPPKAPVSREQIRKLLKKYDLLEKGRTPEGTG